MKIFSNRCHLDSYSLHRGVIFQYFLKRLWPLCWAQSPSWVCIRLCPRADRSQIRRSLNFRSRDPRSSTSNTFFGTVRIARSPDAAWKSRGKLSAPTSFWTPNHTSRQVSNWSAKHVRGLFNEEQVFRHQNEKEKKKLDRWLKRKHTNLKRYPPHDVHWEVAVDEDGAHGRFHDVG